MGKLCRRAHPCAQDVEMHCASIQGGQDKMMDCLHSNQKSLSTSCTKFHSCLKTKKGCPKQAVYHPKRRRVYRRPYYRRNRFRHWRPRDPVQFRKNRLRREEISVENQDNIIRSLQKSVARARQRNSYLEAKEHNVETRLDREKKHFKTELKQFAVKSDESKLKKFNTNLLEKQDKLKHLVEKTRMELMKYEKELKEKKNKLGDSHRNYASS